MKLAHVIVGAIALAFASGADAGPIAYGICQTGKTTHIYDMPTLTEDMVTTRVQRCCCCVLCCGWFHIRNRHRGSGCSSRHLRMQRRTGHLLCCLRDRRAVCTHPVKW